MNNYILTIDDIDADLFAKHLDYSNNSLTSETKEEFVGRKLIEYMATVINRPLAENAYKTALQAPLTTPIQVAINNPILNPLPVVFQDITPK